MSTLIKFWLALMAGGIIAAMVYRESGYVLLSYGAWSVEMSLALLLLLIAAVFVSLYLLIRFLSRLIRLPAETRAWKQQHGARLARRTLTHGLLELSEGNWASAERQLVKYAERSDTPLLNYLAAARAAQLQGAHARRDSYIRLAHESMPSAKVAVSLTQAELQLADNQLEQALATLRHLRHVAPNHAYVLRMLRRLYEQLGDWDQLKELLPVLQKRGIITAKERYELEVRIHRAFLERASISVEKTRVVEIWEQVPRKLKRDTRLVADYASYLQERNKPDQAEALIRHALRSAWSDELVELYGQLLTEKPSAQLAFAETLLESHQQHPILLLALGRLCLRAKLWGKARGYLEASIGAGGPAAAYSELGYLLEHSGEPERALEVYRKGLNGPDGPIPLPLPDNIGAARANKPLSRDNPNLEPPPPHGARPAAESS